MSDADTSGGGARAAGDGGGDAGGEGDAGVESGAGADDRGAAPADPGGGAPADDGGRADLLSLVPWVLLSAGWLVLTVAKLADLTTVGAAAGVAFALALTVGGTTAVVKYGTGESAKLLAGALFVVGGIATVLSATGAEAAWFPNDVVTTVADVTILGALLLVLGLKTEAGRAAVD